MRKDRVLLVEDNADDVELTLWALAGIGLRDVKVALNGVQALTALGEGLAPDLVLLDLRLPWVDGQEVLARIRASPALQDTRVVVLTSSNNPEDLAACLAQGVLGYLNKPLDPQALVAILNQARP